jgi:O-antigen/teichoic acid export membrane protein
MITKLLKDSFSSILVPLVKLAITFVMAPVIVHALGNYDYGVWEIVFSLIAYMEFLDFGLLPAIVRNVARHHALREMDELHKIFSSSLMFFIPVGLITSGGLLIAAFWAPEYFLQGTPTDSHKYTIFFLVISIQAYFVFVGSVFDCFLEGLQLYWVKNYATILFSIIGVAFMYPLLKGGGGLLTLAIVNTCGLSLKYILYGIVLANHRTGGFRFRMRDVSRQTLRGMFNFGMKSFVWALSLRISTLTDPLIIGAFLGASVVPFYMIPANFIGQARSLIWSVTRIFLPLFSTLDARNDIRKTREVYLDASRYMLGIIIPLLGGIWLLGSPFISLWMGHEYAEKGVYVLYLLIAAHFVPWLNPFSRRFLTAIDKHEILAKVGMICAAINLSLSLLLVRYIGKEGVALATLLPLLAFEPYLLFRTNVELQSSVKEYAAKVFLPLLVPAIAFMTTLWVLVKIATISSLMHVVILACASVAVYVPTFFVVAMKKSERQKIIVRIRNAFPSVS